MARRKFRDEIKKPDPIQWAMQYATTWAKENRKKGIVAAAVLVLIILSGWGYGYYRTDKDEKAQDLLSQGLNRFQEYTANPAGDALPKAEETFRKAAGESSGGVRDIAKLYLARIDVIQGRKEQARGEYTDLSKRASSDVVRRLSEAGLRDLDKKQ